MEDEGEFDFEAGLAKFDKEKASAVLLLLSYDNCVRERSRLHDSSQRGVCGAVRAH